MSNSQFAAKFAVHCSLALCAITLCLAPAAQAADAATGATAAPVKKVVKAKTSKAKAKAEAEPKEDEPDTAGSASMDFNCEMGNKITIYSNDNDVEHIALRWKQRLHRLTRVGTTTGAQRYENKLFGLIWIGIPAKGMLLDSKQNRQLANECKNAEQAKPVVLAAPAAEAQK